MRDLKELEYFKAWLLFFFIVMIAGGLAGLIIESFVAAFLGAAVKL
jgi:hypothetical protein